MKAQYSWDELEKLLSEAGFPVYEHLNADEATETFFQDFNVIGNDVTVTLAAEAGQLELNAFEPIIFYNLFQSIDTLGFAIETFVDNCVTGITANEERCREHVERSVGIVTTLAPVIGYQHAADIAKKALSADRPVRDIILEEGVLTPEETDRLLDPVSMTEPGISGKKSRTD